MTDRADEIAREIVLDYIPDDRAALQEELAAEIAAALRSYGNERLEEAAHHLAMSGTTSPSQSMEPAAKLVRSHLEDGGTVDAG